MPSSWRNEVSLKEWTCVPVSNAAESGNDEKAIFSRHWEDNFKAGWMQDTIGPMSRSKLTTAIPYIHLRSLSNLSSRNEWRKDSGGGSEGRSSFWAILCERDASSEKWNNEPMDPLFLRAVWIRIVPMSISSSMLSIARRLGWAGTAKFNACVECLCKAQNLTRTRCPFARTDHTTAVRSFHKVHLYNNTKHGPLKQIKIWNARRSIPQSRDCAMTWDSIYVDGRQTRSS